VKYEQIPPDPLHISGFWYLLQPGNSSMNMTNPVLVHIASGEMRGVAIAPMPSSPLAGGILVLFPRSGPRELMVAPGDFRLMFVGGLAENLADPSVSSSFLALQYPAGDISALRLVDFVKDRGVADALQAADEAASGRARSSARSSS
jgi:hypothetical protein